MLHLLESKFPYKGKYWHELSRKDRGEFERHPVQYSHIDGERFSRKDLIQMFLDLNAAGVPQTEEHLAKVRGMIEAEK